MWRGGGGGGATSREMSNMIASSVARCYGQIIFYFTLKLVYLGAVAPLTA